MRMRYRKKSGTSSQLSVGWLFADLLLALAMLFLIANTITTPVKANVKLKPTPTKVAVKPSPSPTQPPRLELQFHELKLIIDEAGLLGNTEVAIDDVKQQVQTQSILQGRNVGLVIVYGGAPTDNDIGNAQATAAKVYDILRTLGQEKFAFERASYYSTLYLLGASKDEVTLDVYLFAQ